MLNKTLYLILCEFNILGKNYHVELNLKIFTSALYGRSVLNFLIKFNLLCCQIFSFHISCPTFLPKECLDIFIPSITKLVNCSLAEGVVPKGFKNPIVTPLLIKATLPQDDMKNYRLVSGLSFLSKLVERVVAKQLNNHVHENSLGNRMQSAYRARHSTEINGSSQGMVCHWW